MYTRLFFLMLILAVPVPLFAQTLGTDKPPEQQIVEIFLKLLFAFGIGVAPWLTGKLTAGLTHVPFAVRAVISTTITSLIGALFGSIPEFPLTMESSAEIGASWGVVGQWIAQKNPALFTPKTVQLDPEPPGPTT